MQTSRLTVRIICGAGYVSGKEIMGLGLGRGLAARGHDVSYVTSTWTNGDFPGRLRLSGLHHCALPIGFISATLDRKNLWMTAEQICRWPELAWRYRRLAKRSPGAVVIHTNWHHLLLLLPLVKSEREFLWLHEVVPDKPQYRTVFGWFARQLKGFLCVSEAVAASLRRIGISDLKISVIHNGLPVPELPADVVNAPNGCVRIGIVGQIGRWKGHEDLLLALARLHALEPQVELHVFGTGDPTYQQRLQAQAIELGIDWRICWKGFVKRAEEIYPRLDICVVPSRSEDPLPTVAIEAGFYGVPVVATTQGGLPEIIEDQVTGFLVPAAAPEALAEQLLLLVRDPELRVRVGASARQRMIQHFSEERFVDEFERILTAVPSHD